MYVYPDGIVEYFGDLGLSPDYSDSMYFASEAAKNAAFAALPLVARDSNVSYISKDGRHTIRSGKPISQLYNAGYLRYRNSGFENKWFYAFIIEINYINNGTTEIVFSPDSLMTWMGTFTLGECLVIREHTRSDNYAEHKLDEGLPLGQYITWSTEKVSEKASNTLTPALLVSTSAVVVHGEQQSSVEAAEPTLYNGYMISGGKYTAYTLDPEGLENFKNDMDALVSANQVDAILSLHIVPLALIPTRPAEGAAPSPANWLPITSDVYMAQVDNIDGYVPRNKKLFIYPYVLCDAFNSEGSALEYSYEFFTNSNPIFQWTGVCFDVPEAALIPMGYKGIFKNTEECLIQHQFPQASLPIDQYKAWVAQVTSSGWIGIAGKIATTIGNAAGGIASGVAMGNPLGAASSLVGGLTSLAGTALGILEEKARYESLPPAIQGTSNIQILAANGSHDFVLFHKSITAEYAKLIDDYFTAYGYKVNAIKVPTLNNRPAFTFVQTSGANVHGNLPAQDGAKIEAILNSGCRFWKSFSNIGNLHVENGV